MISVVIPVGPFPENKRWLKECLESIKTQTLEPADVIIIDDGANLLEDMHNRRQSHLGCLSSVWSQATNIGVDDLHHHIYHAPWRLGISHAFNFGVAFSSTECVFMLGSDDTLEPTCLERCMQAYLKRNKADGYYSVPIRYMDTDEVQTAPCNAAMVTKGFWRRTGGFPIETAIGIGDSTLLSICIAHKLPVYWVGHECNDDNTPLYNYRRHPDIHTFKLGPWWGVADQIRNLCTAQWNESEVQKWTERYYL